MKVIGTAEAAERLNVTVSRVQKMIVEKRLKATKLGNVWLIDPKDLDALRIEKWGVRARHAKPPNDNFLNN